ncbi:MAG: zf-HC2 domain-containing protein, partial [Gemmatimonadaceae bacterium]
MADDELMRSGHVDEGALHAWLDGALPTDESRAIEAHVGACDVCSAAAAEARGLIAASSRILSALDDVPGDVIPAARKESGANPIPARSRSFVLRYGPIAAVGVFAIGAALVVSSRHGNEPLASTLQSA